MTENTRHETPDVAELRRLLAANETPWALWNGYGPDGRGDMRVERIGHLSGSGIQTDPDSADMYGPREAFELLVSAVNALPGLLDRLAHMREARDNARAEVERLTAKVERVRALPAKHKAGGWYMTSMRDVLAALDEEPQP